MRGSVDGQDHLKTLANDVPVSELQGTRGTRKQQGVEDLERITQSLAKSRKSFEDLADRAAARSNKKRGID